jgi:hypothetical protein
MARELTYQINTLAAIQMSAKLVFVFATDKTRTSGWKNPSLDPVMYITPPADGIQEFNFRATPPSGISLQVLTPIAAEYTWPNPPKWLRGVRVNAEINKKQVPIIRMSASLQAKPKKAAAVKPAAKKGSAKKGK